MGGELRYPGTCSAGRRTSSPEGQLAGIRLHCPEGVTSIQDGCVGTYECDVQREVGDFLIGKKGGGATYQLAVVVDDHAQGVGEVLRGQDLLSSMTRQWHLQNALGLPHPKWYHVPLVVDEMGHRLAKRRDAMSLTDLRNAGVDPRVIVSWVAGSVGASASRLGTPTELLDGFALDSLANEEVILTDETLQGFLRCKA